MMINPSNAGVVGLRELSRTSYVTGSVTGYLLVYEATSTQVGFNYGVYYGIVSVD